LPIAILGWIVAVDVEIQEQYDYLRQGREVCEAMGYQYEADKTSMCGQGYMYIIPKEVIIAITLVFVFAIIVVIRWIVRRSRDSV